MKTRSMSVAGSFYPANPTILKEMLDNFFANVKDFQVSNIKAWVTPHAWYIYSGQVAAYTYEAIRQNLDNIPKNIFVLSPDHYIWMNKILVWNYDELETPFWNLKVNKTIVEELLEYNDIFTDKFLDYDKEHAQETQYPFLKYILGNKSDEFNIIPLIFWQVDIVKVSEILEKYLWKAFFLVSSDLSHYKPYDEAIQIDEKTLNILINKDLQNLSKADACGIFPWGSLEILASKYNWNAKILKYLNSWDTAWDKNAVVGYASVIYS